MVEETFDFVEMEKSDLFSFGAGEVDEGLVEGRDAAAGEIFQKAAEGDEVVGLGEDGERLVLGVFVAVETEAIFANELRSDFFWSVGRGDELGGD